MCAGKVEGGGRSQHEILWVREKTCYALVNPVNLISITLVVKSTYSFSSRSLYAGSTSLRYVPSS
jgi:hypothetical protein